MALLGFIDISFQSYKLISMAFPWFLSFCLPHDKYSGWNMWQQALWDREFTWQGIREDGSLFLVLSGVWTPTTCMAGKCFIHDTMPQACITVFPIFSTLSFYREFHVVVLIDSGMLRAIGQCETKYSWSYPPSPGEWHAVLQKNKKKTKILLS